MSRLFAIAIPIAPGQEEQFRKFTGELRENRYEEFQASRRKLGVRERAFFQQTPMGSLVIVTLEGENPEEAFQEFGKSTDAFTKWFVERVKVVHGVDLQSPPPGPLPELVVDSGPVNAMTAAMHN